MILDFFPFSAKKSSSFFLGFLVLVGELDERVYGDEVFESFEARTADIFSSSSSVNDSEME